jgi:carbonic anhydrase
LKEKLKVDYVDTITEPGPNKILAENKDAIYVESIKRRVAISVNKHGSRIVAVLGHHDCAGNPVDKATQIAQIKESLKVIDSWDFPVRSVGLWVDENWNVSEV